MIEIIAFLDYKGHFGTKKTSWPPNSGMNLSLLQEVFLKSGFILRFEPFSSIDFKTNKYSGKYCLYTSSEDPGNYYKQFLENLVFGLKEKGAIIIPDYPYLLAHNNKVFMEILRDLKGLNELTNIKSKVIGTRQELKNYCIDFQYPIVTKPAFGSMSKGVKLSKNVKELLKNTKNISYSPNFFNDLKELKRKLKYNGYKRHSLYRKPFILQSFISELDHDWKVLVFGNNYYALRRATRPNDFRASGSGIFSFDNTLPEGLLDFAKNVFQLLNVPNVSLDIAFKNGTFYLIEFQAIYFGTTTIEKSPHFFTQSEGKWKIINIKSNLEIVYAESIINYINKELSENSYSRNGQEGY